MYKLQNKTNKSYVVICLREQSVDGVDFYSNRPGNKKKLCFKQPYKHLTQFISFLVQIIN